MSMPSLPLGDSPPVGVAAIWPKLFTTPFAPMRTASSPTAVMMPVALLFRTLLLLVMAAQSIAWPPLVTRIVPLLVRDTAVTAVFTRKASAVLLLISPLFVTVRFEFLTVLSIARPLVVLWIVPWLTSVELPLI